MAFGYGFGFWLVSKIHAAFVPIIPAWIINPGDGAIVFVSTPDFPVAPSPFIATAGDGVIVFKDL